MLFTSGYSHVFGYRKDNLRRRKILALAVRKQIFNGSVTLSFQTWLACSIGNRILIAAFIQRGFAHQAEEKMKPKSNCVLGQGSRRRSCKPINFASGHEK